jgi:hypothetical protein
MAALRRSSSKNPWPHCGDPSPGKGVKRRFDKASMIQVPHSVKRPTVSEGNGFTIEHHILFRMEMAMSAYMVFTRNKTLDQQEMDTYSKEVPATFPGHAMKSLAFYGTHEDLAYRGHGNRRISKRAGGQSLVRQSCLPQSSRASLQRRDVSRHASRRRLVQASPTLTVACPMQVQ